MRLIFRLRTALAGSPHASRESRGGIVRPESVLEGPLDHLDPRADLVLFELPAALRAAASSFQLFFSLLGSLGKRLLGKKSQSEWPFRVLGGQR
jgi:hypothetical protein